MRCGSAAASSRKTPRSMPSSADRGRNEALRRDIEALLAEIDAELARPAPDADGLDSGIERLKQRMITPSFLANAATSCDLPSPAVSVIMPTRNRASFIGEAIASV